jgi:hypothetical protein
VQFGTLFGCQLIIDDQNLDLGTVWQIRGLVEDESAVFHLDPSRLHDGNGTRDQRTSTKRLPSGKRLWVGAPWRRRTI